MVLMNDSFCKNFQNVGSSSNSSHVHTVFKKNIFSLKARTNSVQCKSAQSGTPGSVSQFWILENFQKYFEKSTYGP